MNDYKNIPGPRRGDEMKKWIFLLGLPYVVWHSSITTSSGSIDEYIVVYSSNIPNIAAADCYGKEACADMAEALNEAHEKRLYPNGRMDYGLPQITPCDELTDPRCEVTP